MIELVYYGLTYKIDLLLATKIVQLMAITWGCIHLFLLGKRQAGGFGALFALYLGLHTMEFLDRSGGGHPRAFAIPVILMCAHGIMRKSRIQSILASALGFAIYPPAGLIALGTYVIWEAVMAVQNLRRKKRISKNIVYTISAASLCLAAVSPTYFQGKEEFGELYSYEEAVQMPEFGMDGRLWVIPLPTLATQVKKSLRELAACSNDSPVPFIEKLNEKTKFFFLGFLVLAACLTLIRVAPFSPVPVYLIVSGTILFFLAKALAFRLYSPARMISYAIPCAYLIFMITVFTGLTQKSAFQRYASLVVLFCFICFQGLAFKGPVGLGINARHEQALFTSVQKHPPETLFAGHPGRLSNVPLWGKRPVLITYETSIPWLDKTWEITKSRIYDSFDAYYAETLAPVHKLRKTYNVNYMLIHEDDLLPSYQDHCHFFAPFDVYLKTICSRPASKLVWHNIPPTAIIDRASGFMVVDIAALPQYIRTP